MKTYKSILILLNNKQEDCVLFFKTFYMTVKDNYRGEMNWLK